MGLGAPLCLLSYLLGANMGPTWGQGLVVAAGPGAWPGGPAGDGGRLWNAQPLAVSSLCSVTHLRHG